MQLDFDDDDLGKRRFEFCFVGFVLGGSMQERKGMPVMRREVVLFEKLESISEPMPCGKKLHNGEVQRHLVSGGVLELTLDELDMLHNYLSVVPWQSGTPTRHALQTIDWLQESKNHGRPA